MGHTALYAAASGASLLCREACQHGHLQTRGKKAAPSRHRFQGCRQIKTKIHFTSGHGLLQSQPPVMPASLDSKPPKALDFEP